MKIVTGNYAGASAFAQFDMPVSQMSHTQCKALLEQILFTASPGELYSDVVFSALEIAEQCFKEQGGAK